MRKAQREAKRRDLLKQKREEEEKWYERFERKRDLMDHIASMDQAHREFEYDDYDE